jgi:hypothetical protein
MSKVRANTSHTFADRQDMRTEDRELCADLVKIEWEPESGPLRSDWAILEDISSSGACLQVEQPILPDTIIFLNFPDHRCQARIEYCNYGRMNYLLGVRFEKGYRWSRRRFKPDHLLQFRIRGVKSSPKSTKSAKS